jgi:hypothetical protein
MQNQVSHLSDASLIKEVRQLVANECQSMAKLLSRLAEIDFRKLYASMGYSSLFIWMVKELHLSEDATYKRIQAARAAKKFPVILSLIAAGKVNLSNINILCPILTDDNHEEVLKKAIHKSRREVEKIRAVYAPKPDIPDMIRALPESTTGSGTSCETTCAGASSSNTLEITPVRSDPQPTPTPARREIVAPLTERRVKVQFAADEALRNKIDRAKDLLRHKYPQGKLEDIFDEALEALLEKKDPARKVVRKRSSRPSASHSRYIPQRVKDTVWKRDEGRCQYVSPEGRHCDERGFLEYDHIKPWSHGGSSVDPHNIRLLCRTHNQLGFG